MGYTHYWTYLPRSAQFRAAWPVIAADAAVIAASLPARGILLRGPGGTGLPEIGEARICIDGPPGRASEAFHLSPDGPPLPVPALGLGLPDGVAFWFCRTDLLPYDLAVTAVLLRARQHAPASFAISSDGQWDSGWLTARELTRELFGAAAVENPLGRELREAGGHGRL